MLAVLLQAFGLIGLAVAAFLLFGLGWAVLVASVCAVTAGTVLEHEHRAA